MKEWIISIAGIVFVGVMLEIIMPSGRMNGFIKSMFGIFVLYVIVIPLPNIIGNGLSISSYNSNINNQNFIITTNLTKISELEEGCINLLNENGFEKVSILITSDIYNENFVIEKVTIDLYNLVLKSKDKHININKDITNIISNYLNLEKEKIVIYGQAKT